MIQSIELDVDRDCYSRLEADRGRHILRVLVLTDPPAPAAGDEVIVSLRRRGEAAREIFAETIVYDGEDHSLGRQVDIDLTQLVDTDGFPLAVQDEYVVHAEHEGTVTAETPRLPVALVSTEALRDDWTFGLDLVADDQLRPVTPLSVLTGVRYLRSDVNTAPGAYELAWSAVGKTLSVAGGSPVAVAGLRRTQLVLVGGEEGSGWIQVEATPRALPAEDATETFVLDRRMMDDGMLWRMIQGAAAQVETALGLYLEPRIIATRDAESAAEVVDHFLAPVYLDHDEPEGTRRCWTGRPTSLPARHVQRLDRLTGYLNRSKVVDIPVDWFQLSIFSGLVDFVPSAGVPITALHQGYGHLALDRHGHRRGVSGFYHFRGLAGLWPTPPDVIEWVARSAAVKALTQAATAFKTGVASESIERDGVSEARSYTASAMYHAYSAPLEDHRKWIAANAKRIRQRYGGIVMAV